jgi:hypothetical protein
MRATQLQTNPSQSCETLIKTEKRKAKAKGKATTEQRLQRQAARGDERR